jgi:hypothetical protein
MRSLRAFAVVLAVAAVLVGCGGSTDEKPSATSTTTTTTPTTSTTTTTPTTTTKSAAAAGEFDLANIESRITAFLADGQLPGVEADCPGPVEAKEGATVECTLSGAAIEGKATATLADAAGKDFSLVYEYTSGPNTKGTGNATSVP